MSVYSAKHLLPKIWEHIFQGLQGDVESRWVSFHIPSFVLAKHVRRGVSLPFVHDVSAKEHARALLQRIQDRASVESWTNGFCELTLNKGQESGQLVFLFHAQVIPKPDQDEPMILIARCSGAPRDLNSLG